jgi:hypothetical protein
LDLKAVELRVGDEVDELDLGEARGSSGTALQSSPPPKAWRAAVWAVSAAS